MANTLSSPQSDKERGYKHPDLGPGHNQAVGNPTDPRGNDAAAGDSSDPQNTRLGIVGKAIADKLEVKIHDATGLESNYAISSGRFKGYFVDNSHPDFKGKSEEQIKAVLTEKYHIDPSSFTTYKGV